MKNRFIALGLMTSVLIAPIMLIAEEGAILNPESQSVKEFVCTTKEGAFKYSDIIFRMWKLNDETSGFKNASEEQMLEGDKLLKEILGLPCRVLGNMTYSSTTMLKDRDIGKNRRVIVREARVTSHVVYIVTEIAPIESGSEARTD